VRIPLLRNPGTRAALLKSIPWSPCAMNKFVLVNVHDMLPVDHADWHKGHPRGLVFPAEYRLIDVRPELF
jgi:hypothetical protein